ncbi:16S rRNA (guanine(527)-N(7))-methyltransferase RsmG [Entomospira culicis]|uniref:Ribosomal RNA small subunit methyltransferase G n=1 Tax=Entomospira culicis TaxID=2719989 RepID=A0A968GKJ4_9SPIO|nr:16S rRNA (guanine(527)-N(7))-methyltransferase RsmG [Entomospira culicis]NIZ19560.1 16S rRNA (guanine(527)-N(7))-methyltransferase RsmG [Entomospira culicis]NIZ69535.1 16S rRNA (guanine(527)-N(7))-methyltransferase RsmG [Entomospira culicis]WDI36648.1 16S rRNA (guanine(527)-N(7))-methyltransferase RsmG [Entomospira culicis]WDI38277.1 16S rRNA (guanine(527)-N(7))-methyltransferase RsmG [Entomospira culicis]
MAGVAQAGSEEGCAVKDRLLEDFFKENGHELSGLQLEKMATFLHNIEIFGTSLGLIEARGQQLIVDHLLDSMAPVRILEEISLASLCDVGSGAGFPGIVLAIALPNLPIVLAERMQKRSRFLAMMQQKLQLDNVEVYHGDIKHIDRHFDGMTFRALEQMTCDLAKLLLSKSDRLFAYKGRAVSVQAEVAQLARCGYRCEVEPLAIVGQEKERHLLMIRKT